MENPCDESLIRGAAAALVWSVAAVVVDTVRSGAVFMSRFLRPRARGKRGSATRRRSFAAVIPAISMVGEDLSRNRTDAPAIAGRGRMEDFGIMKECP